ncbi:MAG: type II toxin-antitoxin system RelE/ParE family toxin [Candidatus Rokubacteria bacterium]|nr:type II toxin-antitoxin system RelE/ParE family toxin [Candidatus Rokubacteria bacterium]
MTRYQITFSRSARRELEALDARLVARLWARILGLSDDARPPGCRKLRGEERLWRIRVGEYRVLYSVDDGAKVVDVVAVRHRRDAYR